MDKSAASYDSVLPRSFVFHPLVVLFLSLFFAGLYAVYATLHFRKETLAGHYVYVVPIVIPFIAFLLDRAETVRRSNIFQISLDSLVLGTAMWRVVGHVPYVSGHSLFLSYCLLSTRSRVARVTAALVLLQVAYLKYFVWHDWVTSTNGIVLGTAAAFIWNRCKKMGDYE